MSLSLCLRSSFLTVLANSLKPGFRFQQFDRGPARRSQTEWEGTEMYTGMELLGSYRYGALGAIKVLQVLGKACVFIWNA